MPFRDWQPQYIDEVEEISHVLGLRVIIAHIERYMDQDKRLVKRILDNPDFLIQCNAEFFIERPKQALNLMKTGRIDLLGSDSHNLEHRRPNLADAVQIMQKKDKKGAIDHIDRVSRQIFAAAT